LGLRAEVDDSGEKMGALIRRARLSKIPYVLVVGDEDVAGGTVGVNRRGWLKVEKEVPLRAFLDEVRDEVAGRGRPEDRAPVATSDGSAASGASETSGAA
jgi:threonyl-tRNA synthetase